MLCQYCIATVLVLTVLFCFIYLMFDYAIYAHVCLTECELLPLVSGGNES